MALADEEVVRVVRRRNLTQPEPNSGSTMLSSMTGMTRPTSGTTTFLPMRWAVLFVARVYRYRAVAEDGLGTRRHDDDRSVGAVCELIGDLVELAVLVLVLDFEVGERRLAARAQFIRYLPR